MLFRSEELAKIQNLVREVVVNLARERNFDLIVEQAVYVSEAVDLTNEVLDVLAKLP